MSDYPRIEITKHATSNPDLKLHAKNSQDKWATMQFNTICQGRKKNDNVLEIVVWTNVDSDTDKFIKAQLDVVSFGIFIENLHKLRNSLGDGLEEFKTPVLVLSDQAWVRDQSTGKSRPGEQYPVAKIYLGRDKENRFWISLVSAKQGRPLIKFVFHVPKLTALVKPDGTMLTDAEHSHYALASITRSIEQLHLMTLATKFIVPGSQQPGDTTTTGSVSTAFDDITF